MFCKNCGTEINDSSAFCPHCGSHLDRPANYAQPAPQPTYFAPPNAERQKTNVLAIVGFVLSFFVAIAGLICSIIGYKNAPQYGGNGKGLATAGIVISTVEIALAILVYIIALAALGSAMRYY
ncbi:MAG: zinc-ribbon domain-containing protein [Clostridia bacterium]|nr:zinc-ribbon domain-containing protein [Clostridia bacterium]